MPYLHIAVGKPADETQRAALYARCASLISLLPEKNANNCMVRIETGCDTYFRGAPCACAFVDLRLYTASPEEAKREFAARMSEALVEQFGLEPRNIYLNFIELDHWGTGESYK